MPTSMRFLCSLIVVACFFPLPTLNGLTGHTVESLISPYYYLSPQTVEPRTPHCPQEPLCSCCPSESWRLKWRFSLSKGCAEDAILRELERDRSSDNNGTTVPARTKDRLTRCTGFPKAGLQDTPIPLALVTSEPLLSLGESLSSSRYSFGNALMGPLRGMLILDSRFKQIDDQDEPLQPGPELVFTADTNWGPKVGVCPETVS